MTEYVSLAIDGEVASLHIDRGDRHNSLVPPLLVQLREHLNTIAESDDIGAILLTTAGSSFSTGGDLAAFYEHRREIVPYAERLVGLLNATIHRMLDHPIPIVTAVDGQVTGGSVGFLLASDIVLVNGDATITPYYAVVGFAPDGGWTALMPDVIGRQRTSDVLINNRTIAPQKAVAWGIAHRLVEDDVVDVGRRTAASIAARPRGSIAAVKDLTSMDLDRVEQDLERERREFCRQIATNEAMAGIRSFLDTPS